MFITNISQIKLLVRTQFLLTLVFIVLSQPLYAKEVGSTDYVRGIATAKNLAGKIRILAKGESISVGDELYTTNNSFAIIRFIDDTKMTLRPNTTFKVSQFIYKPKDPESNRGFFSLVRGGLRVITGFLNKKKSNAMRIKSPTAVIGIRGTEFDARLCDGDCSNKKKVSKKTLEKKGIKKKPVGRVAFIRGTLTAETALFNKSGTRAITTGGPIYENDLLKTGLSSFAVIAFKDKSRVTLRANSELLIEQFQFIPAKPTANVFIIRMLKGGLRMLTGLVAKTNRKRTQVRTIAATIGVRGTGFDLLCSGNCGEPLQGKTPAPTNAQQTQNGLFVHVWNGSIVMEQGTKVTELATGWSAFLKNKITMPRLMQQLPKQLKNFKAPRPDKVEVDHKKLFGVDKKASKKVQPGLYVTVYDGHVAVENNKGQVTDIGAGEALVALTDGKVIRLPELPAFQVNDQVPSPKNVNLNKLEAKEVLNKRPIDNDEESLQCTIR